MRKKPTTSWPRWRPDFRELFPLAGPDWTPPANIKLTLNDRRDRLILQARFVQPDGTPVRLKVVSALQGGDWVVVEERIDLKLTFGGAA